MGRHAMIVQDFHLKRYKWHVRVYYAVHRYWTEDIVRDLRDAGCRGSQLMTARENLRRGELNTGITYSNFGRRETVMVVSLTSTAAEFLNSWMHEMQHLCRHVAAAFGIDPYGEEAAYLAGDVGQRMFPAARRFLCDCCRGKMQE